MTTTGPEPNPLLEGLTPAEIEHLHAPTPGQLAITDLKDDPVPPAPECPKGQDS